MLLHPLVLRLLRVSLPTNLQPTVLNTVLAFQLVHMAPPPIQRRILRQHLQVTPQVQVRQHLSPLMSQLLIQQATRQVHPPPNPLTSLQPIALNTAQVLLLLSLLAIAPA